MSKLKVGDRVQVVFGCHEGKRGKIVVDDKSEYSCRYIVRFEPPAPQTGDDSYTWATAADLRRLVKRKRPKPVAPERAMVAATLLAGVFDNESTPDITKWDQEWLSGAIRTAYALADRIIAEGAK